MYFCESEGKVKGCRGKDTMLFRAANIDWEGGEVTQDKFGRMWLPWKRTDISTTFALPSTWITWARSMQRQRQEQELPGRVIATETLR